MMQIIRITPSPGPESWQNSRKESGPRGLGYMYLFLGFTGLVVFRKARMKPFKNQALSSYMMSRVFCPYMK